MSLRSLFSSSAIYAVSNLLQRGLTFLLLPLYTRYLTKAEFGAMDLLYQSVFILGLLSSLGLTQGLARGFYLGKPSEEDRRKMLGVTACVLLPVVLITGLILYAASAPLCQLMFKGKGDPVWLKLTAVFYLGVTLLQLPLQYLRTTQQAKKFAATHICLFVFLAVMNILFIVVLHWGLRGMILANVIGFCGAAIVLFPGFIKSLQLNFELHRLKPLAYFGMAMLPALLGRKVLEISDRYIIPQFCSLDELGVYVLGAKVSNLLDVLILVPFLNAWQPFFYSQSDNPDAPKTFARVTLYMTMLLSCVFLAMEVISTPLISVLGGGQYKGAESVITLLVLAVVFNGIQYTIAPGIHFKKKLFQETGLMLVAALVNIVLNFALIPSCGRDGAALATAAAYGSYLFTTFWLSQRNYPVSYPWPRIWKIVILTIAAWLAIHHFPSFIARCAVLVVYTIACPVYDLWRNDQLVQRLARMKKRFTRRKEEIPEVVTSPR